MLTVSLIHVFCLVSLANFLLVAILAVYTFFLRRRITRNSRAINALVYVMDLVDSLLFEDKPCDNDTKDSEQSNENPDEKKTNPLT